MKYLFGDTDIAAQRLGFLARVFSQSTKAFILRTVTHRPRLALDLGCGPGYFTHFLAEVLQCGRIVGLDNSEHFISLAQNTQTDKVSFCLHDVTAIPFPVGPGDLLYCRFLLTHLRDVETVLAKWATQIRSGGFLLMEEVEWIHTENRVFTTYLRMVEAMLKHQSNELYVGAVLNDLEDTDILKRQSSQVRRLPVPNHDAARMFFLNIQSWRHDPFIQSTYSSQRIHQLAEDLRILTEASESRMEIEWGLRQLVFQRL